MRWIKQATLAGLLVSGAMGAALAESHDEASCRALFAGIYTGATAQYPNGTRSVTKTGGQVMEGRAMSEAEDRWMSMDDTHGIWSMMRGQTGYSSRDEGKSWTKSFTFTEEQRANAKAESGRRAEAATDVTCTDDVEFEGRPYKRVSGTWKASDGTGMSGTSTFYLDADGDWYAQEVVMDMAGSKTEITQVRLPEDEWVPVSEPE